MADPNCPQMEPRHSTLKPASELEEFYREVLQAAEVGVWEWRVPENLIEYHGVQWRLMGFGAPVRNPAFDAVFSHILPEDREAILLSMQKAFDSQEDWSGEYRVQWPDGSLHWILGKAKITYNQAGKPLLMRGVNLDITQRKRVEDEFHAISEVAPQFVWISDEKGNLIYTNTQLQRLVGATEPELLGSRWAEVLHPDDKERTLAIWTNAIQTGQPYETEFRVRDPEGKYVWLLNRAVPIREASGKIRRWTGISVDITEQVHARLRVQESEKRLEASERQFRNLAEAMPQMAFVADAQGNILYNNRRHYEYFNGDAEQTLGWAWVHQTIHHPDDVERTVQRWKHSIETGEPYEMEYRLRCHDGQYRWHLGRALPIRNEQGEITQWLGTNTDIHDLREAQEALKSAVRVRDEFLSISSHELKTPLTSLRLSSQIMKRNLMQGNPQALNPERIFKTVDQIDRQVSRLVHLVDDMLDVSRIQAGRLTMHLQEFDSAALIQDVVERMRPTLESSDSSRIDLNLEPGAVISADPFRVEQIVVNLLSNAGKYGKGGRIAITTRRERDHLCLQVRDHGPGIPEADRERIFNRFERGVSPNEVAGLGLGLYITRQIVEGHQGRIWVEPAPGGGSVFKVELPGLLPPKS